MWFILNFINSSSFNSIFFLTYLVADTFSLILPQTLLFLCSSSGSGEDDEQLEQPMESMGLVEEEFLKCFRCDLGFWDTCYTTEINCSIGERCYTGRGKAGVLDKTVVLVSVY